MNIAESQNPYAAADAETFDVRMSPSTDINGTSLQGELYVHYDFIVKVFGEMNSGGDGYKIDYQWLGTINGKPFSIYNWKNGPGYLDIGGKKPEEILDWHIGAHEHETYNELVSYMADIIDA